MTAQDRVSAKIDVAIGGGPDFGNRDPRADLEAAQEDRRLAAEQLREIAGERNKLRRELAALEEKFAKLKASRQQEEELRYQVQQLSAALEEQKRINEGLQTSLSWKLTRPLRACLHLIRGKA
ncbi:MAG: hypothetical protein JOY54_04035 [Acidobacteriaceae bacterium]|nr:hypothetical protein [Acidobacteriaceae bacterium]